MFYNYFYKVEYLETIDNEKTRDFNSSLFRKSQPLEEQLKKDLYNFNTNEIEILLYAINSSQLNTLKTYVYYARKYTSYSIKKGKKTSNINPYESFTYQILYNYLAKYKLKYFSSLDFDNILKDVYNEYDKALYMAIFEGIGGDKYSELSNLKKVDLENAIEKNEGYLLELYNTEKEDYKTSRELLISKELMNLLKRTANSDTYYPANGESKTRAFNYIVEGEYVFRNTGSQISNENVKIDKQYIYRRMKLLEKITEGTVTSIKTVSSSGIIYYLSKVAENEKIHTDDAESIMERFHVSINTLSVRNSYRHFLKKYEDGLEAIYGIKTIID